MSTLLWYKFEDNTDDSSGNEYTGTWVGSATYADGKVGRCAGMLLDGNYIINESPIDLLSLGRVCTIDFWVKRVTIDAYGHIVFFYSPQQITMWFNANNTLYLSVRDSTYWELTTTDTFTSTTEWYHFTVVKDNSFLGLYVNGVLNVSRDDCSGTGFSGNVKLWLASDNAGTTIHGYIDEFKITSTADYPPVTYEKTIYSNAWIEGAKKTINSNSYIKKLDNDKTIISNSFILVGETESILSTSHIQKLGIEKTLYSNAQVIKISQTILVYPSDGGKDTSPVTFRWQIPSDVGDRDMNCELVVGSTTYRTWIDSGFEYWDGDSWETYPVDGVSSTYYDNEARKSVTIDTTGNVIWKVRGACETV